MQNYLQAAYKHGIVLYPSHPHINTYPTLEYVHKSDYAVGSRLFACHLQH